LNKSALPYVRINRWAKNGVLERVFQVLQEEYLTNRVDNGGFPEFKLGKSPS
jgi:hypothetical protein